MIRCTINKNKLNALIWAVISVQSKNGKPYNISISETAGDKVKVVIKGAAA